ncbi:hypothetical protein OHA21_19795 [Actinoplanes sp. NBC_00393]|uniref:hypothetical protein n=1 Tax=Actinoplanes sp. NBC_00393 TaxID=2975953 RepID=UPI002E1EF58C
MRRAFLLAVPLAWAVLLLFHPNPDPGDMYDSLRDEPGRWLTVHLGTLFLIGLMGAAVYLLVDGLPGTAAKISRVGAGVFAVFYGAGEAIQGIGVGVLVQHVNQAPESERVAGARAVQALWDNPVSDDLAVTIGAIGWAVAVFAAAAAVHRAGAPLAATVLLGLSSIVLMHAPPIGPVGLLCFAAAVVVLDRSPRRGVDHDNRTTATGRTVRRGPHRA